MTPGSLVCIVGRVGTGKSAMFSAMINGMKRLQGEATFGGSVSFGEFLDAFDI